jgi:hypothetical protein
MDECVTKRLSNCIFGIGAEILSKPVFDPLPPRDLGVNVVKKSLKGRGVAARLHSLTECSCAPRTIVGDDSHTFSVKPTKGAKVASEENGGDVPNVIAIGRLRNDEIFLDKALDHPLYGWRYRYFDKPEV